jgi:hypothetical protein
MKTVVDFTDKIVRNFPLVTAESREANHRIWDAEQRGLLCRVGRTGRVYAFMASVKNKTRGPITIGDCQTMTVKDARRAAREMLDSFRDGDATTGKAIALLTRQGETLTKAKIVDAAASVSVGEHTLQDAMDAYMGRAKILKQSTLDGYKETLNRYTPAGWFARPLAAIEPDEVVDRHAEISRNNGRRVADGARRIRSKSSVIQHTIGGRGRGTWDGGRMTIHPADGFNTLGNLPSIFWHTARLAGRTLRRQDGIGGGFCGLVVDRPVVVPCARGLDWRKKRSTASFPPVRRGYGE